MHNSLGFRFLPAPLGPRQHRLLVGALRLVLGHPMQEAHDLGHELVHVLGGHLLQRLHGNGQPGLELQDCSGIQLWSLPVPCTMLWRGCRSLTFGCNCWEALAHNVAMSAAAAPAQQWSAGAQHLMRLCSKLKGHLFTTVPPFAGIKSQPLRQQSYTLA